MSIFRKDLTKEEMDIILHNLKSPEEIRYGSVYRKKGCKICGKNSYSGNWACAWGFYHSFSKYEASK